MPQYELSAYIGLLERFVNGDIPASEFEHIYLRMFKQDPTIRPETEYQILNRLFSDVDAFCADPELRSINDLDEAQLSSRALSSLRELQALSAGGDR